MAYLVVVLSALNINARNYCGAFASNVPVLSDFSLIRRSKSTCLEIFDEHLI